MEHTEAEEFVPQRGTNLLRMGDYNQRVVIDAVRRAGGKMSRVALSKATGLSAQTVSNICRRLIDQGVIAESGKESSRPGKPRTLLELNADSLYAIGVHVDPVQMTFVLLDVFGRTVARSTKRLPATAVPRTTLAAIGEAVAKLMSSSGIDAGRVAGIGVAAPGPIDLVRGLIIDPPQLSAWHAVPLRQMLADITGLPVFLEKDTRAAALAELWAGASSSFVLFYFGSGLGAGIAIHGEALGGVSGNAGEIGHIIVDPDGPRCVCGLRGCLGATSMPEHLVAEAERRGVMTGIREGRDPRSVAESLQTLCDRADEGDEAGQAILREAAERVAIGTSVLVNLLDVGTVICGGPFWDRLQPHYLPTLRTVLPAHLVAHDIHSVTVEGTSLGKDIAAIGAGCLVLHETLSPTAGVLQK
ncbi:MAG: ROK family transcriptional regulator [Microbacterium sp.]|uniref:ROK family transcriptional regulator n=1 Tax=Microbacterium sp. TaxID=51671 RepID=UPI0039E45EA2